LDIVRLAFCRADCRGSGLDNMLVHLLHGEVTVDREAIDFEAFTHDGKTYAYFGVFPALLRLPALPFVDVAQVPLARLSCLTAVVFYVAVELRMLVIVHRSAPPQNRLHNVLGIMMAATVSAGHSFTHSARPRYIMSRYCGRRQSPQLSTSSSCTPLSGVAPSACAIWSGWRSLPDWRSTLVLRSVWRSIWAPRF
jgi:hypothetical protein